MADSQLTLRAQVYGRNIMQLAQQSYAKLYPAIYLKGESINGKTFFQDQIGEWEMAAKGGLNVATPQNDPNLARRMAIINTYHDSRVLDRSVNLQILSDPKSASTIAAASSLGRKIDDVIIDSLGGTALSGETGSTSNTLPSSQQIAEARPGVCLQHVGVPSVMA